LTVLRELVARLGFEVDKAGFAAAERGVAGIKGALAATARAAGGAQSATAKAGAQAKEAAGSSGTLLKTLAGFAASVGLTGVMHQMVEMASSAQETNSLLDQVFGGEGGNQVRAWSETAAESLGRSRFALQQFAGTLGAVIDPMVGNKAVAQEMSTTLSGLAVDMASFFNATDQDAMLALRSAMTGEVESMKKFGVVMNDATLKEYALSVGIKKKILSMSNAEKTQLRYGYIMKATKNAQGDAARTANGFANASRALKDSLRDLGTTMGQAVLPYLEKVIMAARDGLKRFKEMAAHSNILQTAMIVLAGVAGALAISMLSAFILPVAGVLALIWLVDQLRAMFGGGRSAIGDFIDESFGIGTTNELVNTLVDLFAELGETWAALPDIAGMWEIWSAAIDNATDSFLGFLDTLNLITSPLRWIWELGKMGAGMFGRDGALYKSGLLGLVGLKPVDYAAEGRSSDRGLKSGVMSADETRSARRTDREGLARSGTITRAQARADRRTQMQLEREDAGMSIDTGESIDPNMRSIAGRAVVRARRGTGAAGPAAAAPIMSVNTGATTANIVIHTNDPDKMRRVVEDVLKQRDDAALSSLPREPLSE
jgi:hypothetical protein